MILYLIVIFVLLYAMYRRSIRHLLVADKMFVGPMKFPIIGNALWVAFGNSEDLYDKFQEICYFYRRSFRLWIGPRLFIFILHPEDAEVVLGNNFEITKADAYEFLLPWIGDGLLTSTGKKWRKHRKMLTPAFHFNILEKFVQIFNKNGDTFCEILSNIPEDKVVDVYDYVKMYALDNICEAAMGVTIDAQRNPNSAYIKAVKDICVIAFKRMRVIWLRFNPIFKLTKWSKIQEDALKIIHGMTNDVIQKRKSEMQKNPEKKLNFDNGNDFNPKGRLAFLDILLHSADEYGLTNEDIREEVDTFMFEGHDTITSGISFALYYIAKYPEVQEKVIQEMDSIFQGENRPATVKDLQAMKYLEQVIKECLRLHPSVPLIGRKLSEDLPIDIKATAPKGSEVVIVVAALHRHPHYWEKSDQFYPEHFSQEAVQKRHPYAFVPFSAGPRNCIGQRFALLEMKSALSKIVKKFELLPSPHAEHQIKEKPELVMTSATGMHIRFKNRKN